jgi:hypothetical protein
MHWTPTQLQPAALAQATRATERDVAMASGDLMLKVLNIPVNSTTTCPPAHRGSMPARPLCAAADAWQYLPGWFIAAPVERTELVPWDNGLRQRAGVALPGNWLRFTPTQLREMILRGYPRQFREALMDLMDVSWYSTDENNARTMLDILRAEGVQVRERLGFEPLTTIGVVVAAGALLRVLTRLYKDARYKGVVIDATRHPIEIREMAGWPRQQLLLISSEGARLMDIKDTTAGLENIDQIGELLKKAAASL